MANNRTAPIQGKARLGRDFWVFTAFVALVFLTGGGSRYDILSLPVLRFAAALAIGFGLVGLTRSQFAAVRGPFLLLAAMACVIIVQLIPLPTAMWTALPGREPLIAGLDAAGIEHGWRPISIAPYRSWNSLFAILVPLGGLILFAKLSKHERTTSVSLVLVVAVASALLAVMQMGGEPGGPLYLYEVTNPTSAVGLFANRNHQGFFLASAIALAVMWWQLARHQGQSSSVRLLLAVGLIIVFLILLIATGSRGALLVGAAVLAATPWLVPVSERTITVGGGRKVDIRLLLIVGTMVVGAAWMLLSDRTEAISRLSDQSFDAELRFALWQPMLEMLKASMPVGFGVGTFAETYRWFEPDTMLRLSYVNQAHNDLVDIFVSFGVLGAVPLVIGSWLVLRSVPLLAAGKGVQFQDVAIRRMALLILLALGVASLFDYPLRVPSLALLFILSLAIYTIPSGN